MTAADPSDSSSSAFAHIRPGMVVSGRYEIVRMLGEGGMGAVFEARHTTIGRRVAIKFVHPQLAETPQLAARFLQEARTAAEIRHPNVVEVSDFSSEGSAPYLVMEYLEGESLGALLERDAPLSPSVIIPLLDATMRALSTLHRKLIVHRDIKPDNIFLARDDSGDGPTPKLLDFGIAKRESNDDVRLTATGAAMGTPVYMAPEQVMGAKSVSAAADQYALGAIFYEAFTGRTPHEAETYNALIVAKVTAPPVDLSALRPDLPAELCAVVMRALALRAEDRFESVDAFRRALEPFASLRIDGARAVPVSRPDAVELASTAYATAESRNRETQAEVPASLQSRVGSQSEAARLHAPRATEPMLLETDAPVERPSMVPQGARSRSNASVIGVLAVAVVAIAGVATWRLTARGNANATEQASRAAQGSTANTEPTQASPRVAQDGQITVALEFEPREAEIFLDDQRLGAGRAAVVLPRDGRRHQLRVTANGYTPFTDVIVADADSRVSRALAAVSAHGAAASAPQAAAAPGDHGSRTHVRAGGGASPLTATATTASSAGAAPSPPTNPTSPTNATSGAATTGGDDSDRGHAPRSGEAGSSRSGRGRRPNIDRENPFGAGE